MAKKAAIDQFEKYQMEFEVRSSPRILYPYLSTPSGLAEWFADDVRYNDGTYSFEWDGTESKAKMSAKKDNSMVRFQWLEGENEGLFFQIDIVQDELTADVALVVIDHSRPDEVSSNRMLWEQQVLNLKHVIGS